MAPHGCGSNTFPRFYCYQGPFAHQRSIRVHYGGHFQACNRDHRVDYVGGKHFWIHQIDPENFLLGNLFELVGRCIGAEKPLPNEVWYANVDEDWPSCIKTLHTDDDLKAMFVDLDKKREFCGVVYMQDDAIVQVDDEDNAEINVLPFPLNQMETFELVYLYHLDAIDVKETLAELDATHKAKMEYERELPVIGDSYMPRAHDLG